MNQAGMLAQNFSGWDGVQIFNGDFTPFAPKLNYGTKCFLNAMTIISEGSGDKTFGNSWVISAGVPQAIIECMTVSQALALDTKLDDGIPGAGDIQEMYGFSGPRVNSNGGCDNNSDTTKYNSINMGNNLVKCQLAIKAKW